MAVEFSEELLKNYNINKEDKEKIINCIASHHKDIPFKYLEAEIVANLDCYRFIHPYCVFSYLIFLTKTSNDIKTIIKKAKTKMDEKYKYISLKEVKDDLDEFYLMFSKQFNVILGENY